MQDNRSIVAIAGAGAVVLVALILVVNMATPGAPAPVTGAPDAGLSSPPVFDEPEPVALPPRPQGEAQPPPESIVATWQARVVSVTGEAPAQAGQTCVVSATIDSATPERLALDAVSVVCDGSAVFDTGSGGARGARDVRLEPWPMVALFGRPDRLRIELAASEIADDRSTLAIAEWGGGARIHRDEAPAYEVRLSLDAMSEPVLVGEQGRRAIGGERRASLFGPLVASDVDGYQLGEGARCGVLIIPSPPDRCGLLVRCGELVLYGRDGDPVEVPCPGGSRFEDTRTTVQDGTPRIRQDPETGAVILEDEVEGMERSITLTVAQ